MNLDKLSTEELEAELERRKKPPKPKKPPEIRLAVITNCMSCPHVKMEATPGAGCATDYYCSKAATKGDGTMKMIAGYVEWASEGPQDNEFPDFCPLESRPKP